MSVIKTIELENGYVVKVKHDSNADSPRDWDNMGTMVCFHNRYTLGDDKKHWGDFNGSTPNDLAEFLKSENVLSLPLYLYDHSGITMATKPFDCRFDSGQVGYIFTTMENALIESPMLTDETQEAYKTRILGQLEAEVNTYDTFIRGNVFGYNLEDAEGNDIDSCWGFFGYNHEESGLMESAREAAENDFKNDYLERLENSHAELNQKIDSVRKKIEALQSQS
jgi:hypothetical protein